MLEETIEELTKQMIEEDFVNRNKNNKLITMNKVDLYKFCIKLVKLMKRIEEME